jgi:glycosyltransferase involved in cell wall biosynthesis
MPMPRRPLHVVQISFFSDPAGRSPVDLLQEWPTLAAVAEAASRAGVRVSVVQASAQAQRLTRHSVDYYFLPFGAASVANDGAPLADLLPGLAADVFHVHGLGFPRHVISMSALAPGVPIVLQDHADRVPRLWHRALWRRALAAARGVTFCAVAQAQPFIDAGLMRADTPLYSIPESTSRFTPGDRELARRATGLAGEPAILWVGHLDANKDPLTVLEGISHATRALPGLQLFCCFGAAPLLRGVRARIAADPALRGRVHLLGSVPHATIEELMRAADLFVLGSHRESTGYSLIEALSCGLPPVVTDIPSFRSLTGGGAVGALWRCGEPRSLCEALLSVAARADSQARLQVRTHFEHELSFDALGSKLAAMYHDLLERKRGHQPLEPWTPEAAAGTSRG